MRNINPEVESPALWVVLILAGIVTLGCNRPPPLNPEVPTEERILMLVEDVDDFSQNKNELERIKQLFVPGSAPSKEALLRYMAYRYEGNRPSSPATRPPWSSLSRKPRRAMPRARCNGR